LTQDRGGSVRHRLTKLRRVVRWSIARVTRRCAGKLYPLAIYTFALQYGARGYSFTFVADARKIATYLPLFERSAHSIAFDR
jgi:hypothetical protein